MYTYGGNSSEAMGRLGELDVWDGCLHTLVSGNVLCYEAGVWTLCKVFEGGRIQENKSYF